MGFVNPVSMKGPAEVVHGWMFIGLAMNLLLLGVMLAQVYMYYVQYRDDRAWIKIMVGGVFVLDITNTIFLFIYLYRSLIVFYGEPEFLAQVDWMVGTGAWTTGVIACIAQLFFAWRIFVLTRSWFYVIIIGSLALAGGIAAIVLPAKTGLVTPVSEIAKYKPIVTTWLACEVAADVVITSVLVWFLRMHKSGFKNTDMMVDRIIRFTIQTGLVTVIVASIDLFFFLYDPTGTHFLFNLQLAKLYSNSLMSSLNSRRGWKFNGTNSPGGTSSSGPSTTSWIERGVPNSTVKFTNDSLAHDITSVHLESQELRDVRVQGRANFDERFQALNKPSSEARHCER